ncbi:MAG: HesA/MoeB/ThiF family protein [Pseudanabaenaceae cyanobacterium SKYGB_i_bin29]|nr:HesA/MoeB/ThiF family protein [Pseudanabaenaceae cyanobacterium SKYG29]MDW8422238.1 HesA/MoeB/ThiF family protein [Pseudanabaenaceae cyanobacterium SKYGB_i_bin29]
MELSPQELERYRRQIQLPGFGKTAQLALKQTTVLITGVGGLGGTVALYLTVAGIGKLILVRGGNLRLDDMNRQVLMTHDWVGKPRIWRAKTTLEAINPDVVIEAIPEYLIEENRRPLVKECDLAVSCAHNFDERSLLNLTCVEQQKPMVEAAMDGMTAYLTTIVPGKTPCLSCLYPEFPAWDKRGFGVLGAVSGTLACLAALEVIKFVTGLASPLVGELLVMQLDTLTFHKYRTYREPHCPICSHL